MISDEDIERIAQRVVELLKPPKGHRPRNCARCNNAFIPTRRDQNYCTVRCAAAARQARRRATQ